MEGGWLEKQFAPQRPSELGFTETTPLVKGLLVFWFILLAPWLIFAPLSAMASESGKMIQAWIFIWSAWLYPVSLYLAFLFRQKKPVLVFLPAINVIVWFAAGL